MSLEISDAYKGLPVCKACGWPMAGPYEEGRHRSPCPYAPEGSIAAELAHRLPEVPSTKYGYGTGKLTFKIADDDFEVSNNFSITLRPDPDGSFSLDRFHMLESLTPDRAEVFIQLLHTWWKVNHS